MTGTFPVEAIPDGATWAPHHLYVGVLVALVPLLVVWDDRSRAEPWALLAALLAVLFGFGMVWRYYAAAGALLTLAGVLVALVLPLTGPFWSSYPWLGCRGVALVGVLVALDDAVEHAFGVPTPLDVFWTGWLHGVIT